MERHSLAHIIVLSKQMHVVTVYKFGCCLRRDKDIPGSVPQMVCYVHPTEQLLLYCQSCKKAVCSYCVTEVHYKYSHRVSYIEHLIEDEKVSMPLFVMSHWKPPSKMLL